MKRLSLILVFILNIHCLFSELIITRSQTLGVKKHCLIPWNDSTYYGHILNIENEIATVQIIDLTQDVDQWPTSEIPLDKLQPVQSYQGDSLEGLIDHLKHSKNLVTPHIEEAFRTIDRGWFCNESPYFDASVYIGFQSCISSPHMHAIALEICKKNLQSATSILDIGSGSGYLTAIMAHLAPKAQVIGIEYLPSLVDQSLKTIKQHLPTELVNRITIAQGDGEKGFSPEAPYDLIYVGFMCEEIPKELLKQLAPRGRLLIPVGKEPSRFEGCRTGYLTVIDKIDEETFNVHQTFACAFVPSSNSESY